MDLNKHDQQYFDLLYRFDSDVPKVRQTNVRTDEAVVALLSPQTLEFDVSSGNLIVFGNRKYFPRVAAAEAAWQFLGTKDARFINDAAPKLWRKFTNEAGEVPNAYGYRMCKRFKYDQLQAAVTTLKMDDTNRQCWVQVWSAEEDLPNCPTRLGDIKINKANVPCVVGFLLTRIHQSLNMNVVMRSSDALVGLPYDIMVYQLTLNALAVQMKIDPGALGFTLLNSHYYEKQVEILQSAFCVEWTNSLTANIPIPKVTPRMIAADPWHYMECFPSGGTKHSYAPAVNVVV